MRFDLLYLRLLAIVKVSEHNNISPKGAAINLLELYSIEELRNASAAERQCWYVAGNTSLLS